MKIVIALLNNFFIVIYKERECYKKQLIKITRDFEQLVKYIFNYLSLKLKQKKNIDNVTKKVKTLFFITRIRILL